MPVERANEHPTFEAGVNAITSYAAPGRGSEEAALFRIDMPAGGGLPPHRHDHFDVFTILEGSGEVHIGEDVHPVSPGDSVVIASGELHWMEAGPDGAAIIVAMLPYTKLTREADGVEMVPPWVS
jgi:quercetin dioxygenase-like cupin family protein